jgi:hypothetical protein
MVGEQMHSTSPALKIGLGVLTVMPMLFVFSVVALIAHPWSTFGSFVWSSGVVVLMSSLAGTAYYIYLTMTSGWPESQKTLWLLLLLLWYPFSGPVFWYRYVWRDGRTSTMRE